MMMRWKNNLYLKPREGETRIKRKFLFYPRKLDTDHWRWLEFANVIEQVCKVDIGGSGQWGHYGWYWCGIAFKD